MATDPFIGETMWDHIDRELDAIAREHNVRILFAVESGSRAWRFPSLDSDYDVRFIYAHPSEAYLAIESPRDVIVRPLEGVLDINGWDLRKALQLLVRSNATLLEWLASPVRYCDDGIVAARLLALARETCQPPALHYHYDRMARRNFGDILSGDGSARLKTYCYALRPVLALLWMRRHGEPPPMDLPGLMAGILIADDVRQAIIELVDRKAAAAEQDVTVRVPVLDAFIAETLSVRPSRFTLPDRTGVLSQANTLFASIILGRAERPSAANMPPRG